MPSLSTIAVPKLSAILSAWALSGHVRRTFEGCAFAQGHDAGGLTRGDCGLCHVFFLSNLEAAPARAGLPFRAVAPNRRKTGVSRSEDDRQSGAGLRHGIRTRSTDIAWSASVPPSRGP